MAFDNLCKYIAEQNPQAFAQWILGRKISTARVLKSELSIEPVRADAVTFLQSDGEILHLEFQTDLLSHPSMPLRMLDYWVRLYRKYELPITQVLIMLRETSSEIPSEFVASNTRHSYKILKLWEQNPSSLFQIQSLIPLAVLAREGKNDRLLETVAAQLNRIEVKELRQSLFTQANLLAGLRYNKDLVNRLLREDFMKESVTYQAIIEEGIEIGLQRGLLEATNLAKRQESDLLIRLLERRIGKIGKRDENKIRHLSLGQLENLAMALLDFTNSEDLRAWFKSNQ